MAVTVIPLVLPMGPMSDHGTKRRSIRVAVVGCGFSGIAAGIALQRAGITDFVIFEASDGVGGTWYKNHYPGAEVDLESHLYAFSDAPADWTRTHAGWAEIHAYLERVADEHHLRDHIAFCERVLSAQWSGREGAYHLQTSSDRDWGAFHAVISAVGYLNVPVLPPFVQEGTFTGVLCHTSQWPDDLDLAGKTVGVAGTGSSAVQVIAEAAKQASVVKIFQSRPNWLLPKNARPFSELERAAYRHRFFYQLHRLRLLLAYELRQWRGGHVREGARANRRRAAASMKFLTESLASRPDLVELVTPDYPFEGRRTVISDDYYRTLLLPNVQLVPHPVKDLRPYGALDTNGDEHELDVLVMATGFDATNYLGTMRVRGRDGRELHEVWHGEPQAFLGLMMPGFPNFFMLYGPNTNALPLPAYFQAQARFAARTIARLDGRWRTVEVSPRYFTAFNAWLYRRLSGTVWAQTRSYYRTDSGRVVSNWPGTATSYLLAVRLMRHLALRYS